MSTAKIRFETIDHYAATLPVAAREVVDKIRRAVKKVAPDAVEAISYNMPAYKLHGQSLIHFAAWKEHIGFYPLPPETAEIYKDLAPYLDAKATIRFPLGKPIPYDLIERLVAFRMANISPTKKKACSFSTS